VIGAGDKVVVIMRSPSNEGEPGALSANLTTFRDGKVIEMVHYPDPDEALAAAGALPLIAAHPRGGRPARARHGAGRARRRGALVRQRALISGLTAYLDSAMLIVDPRRRGRRRSVRP
jgi:hypothetical protein